MSSQQQTSISIHPVPWETQETSGQICGSILSVFADEIYSVNDDFQFNKEHLLSLHQNNASIIFQGQGALKNKEAIKDHLTQVAKNYIVELAKITANHVEQIVIHCYVPSPTIPSPIVGATPLVTKKKRLLLDALSTVDQKEWSEARIAAYKNRHKNPNSYYYRFNLDGEVNKGCSNWDEEEIEAVIRRAEEMNTSGSKRPQWGIFSIPIKGRVGYSCQQCYKKLVLFGRIEDPNYEVRDGKLVYLPRLQKKRQRESSSTESTNKKSKIV